MPVATAPFTFDGVNRLIVIDSGVTSIGVRDLWSRWVDWSLDGDNGKFAAAFSTLGGDSIDPDAGTFVPVYAFLQNGWRLRPQEATHTLAVGDGILLVAGGGDPFVDTLGAFVVRVNYQQPVQAISFSSTGSTGPTPAEIAAAVWAAADDVYTAKIGFFDDNVAAVDRYVVTWLKNGAVVSAGVTSPTLRVVQAADGADRVAASLMSEIGALSRFRLDVAGARLLDGASYIAIASAVIGGSVRTWDQAVGRDSV